MVGIYPVKSDNNLTMMEGFHRYLNETVNGNVQTRRKDAWLRWGRSTLMGFYTISKLLLCIVS